MRKRIIGFWMKSALTLTTVPIRRVLSLLLEQCWDSADSKSWRSCRPRTWNSLEFTSKRGKKESALTFDILNLHLLDFCEAIVHEEAFMNLNSRFRFVTKWTKGPPPLTYRCSWSAVLACCKLKDFVVCKTDKLIEPLYDACISSLSSFDMCPQKMSIAKFAEMNHSLDQLREKEIYSP